MRGPKRGPSRVRPSSRSTASRRSSSARGCELGLERRGGVEEPRLVEEADRVGLAERGDGDDVVRPSSSSAPRSAASRSPRFEPSPIWARATVREATLRPCARSPLSRSCSRSAPLPRTRRAGRSAPSARPAALQAIGARGPALVELKDGSGAFALQAARRHAGLALACASGRCPAPRAARLLPRLGAAGVVSAVEPDRRMLRPFARRDVTDPLVPKEWWIPAIGADTTAPPGPGVPVTDDRRGPRRDAPGVRRAGPTRPCSTRRRSSARTSGTAPR